MGFGVFLQLSQIVNIEVLYSGLQYQKGCQFNLSNFQIRFGLD